LPISYRCPKKVIELAKNWATTITCPDTAIDGEIHDISLNEMYNLAKPGCFILSRTNAPLIKICLHFIRSGIPANIRGRDVGKQLSYLIKRSKRKQIPAFLKWLEDWKDAEIKKLQAKRINTDNVIDRFECLTSLCEECKNLEEVVNKIDKLFNDTDGKNIVILSTVHCSKGLETENVFALKWTFRAWLDDCSLFDKPNEEANLAYVCCTRTKNNLYIVRKWK
jgi:superfamily I DNA/RNA helicase